MGRVFQPLLFLLARCTRNELLRQNEWLKAENEMLRKRVDKQRIFLDQEEKNRLMKLGQAIGPSLKHLITIVSRCGAMPVASSDERMLRGHG